tara:strand:+ start:1531 stop:2088 length:558 start_codon:yes stop_codon:yes gene_type:complete
MIKEQNSFGSIEVICGNMFSGKTEELIRRLRRAKIARLNVKIFKPKIDTRYEEGNIVSHNQLKLESLAVKSINELNDLTSDADVVGIDEAQFFDESIIEIAKDLSSKGKRVIIAGLDTDFKGEPFGPMPKLMCEADFLDKLQAICVKCGNPASYTQRLSKDNKQVVIGETDIYEARCRHCYEGPN